MSEALDKNMARIGAAARLAATALREASTAAKNEALLADAAAIEAESSGMDPRGVAAGLLLYASYPATDMSDTLGSSVLSVSASLDGLATPADIDASKANLPPNAQFVVIDGAVHAFFGDYGPQPGDGTPTISHDDARSQIVEATAAWLAGLTP